MVKHWYILIDEQGKLTMFQSYIGYNVQSGYSKPREHQIVDVMSKYTRGFQRWIKGGRTISVEYNLETGGIREHPLVKAFKIVVNWNKYQNIARLGILTPDEYIQRISGNLYEGMDQRTKEYFLEESIRDYSGYLPSLVMRPLLKNMRFIVLEYYSVPEDNRSKRITRFCELSRIEFSDNQKTIFNIR